MAHCVDACVQRVKAPACNSVLDCILSQLELMQLPSRHHPILLARQQSDPRIPSRLTRLFSPRPQNCAYTTIFCGLGGHGMRVPRYGARVVRGSCHLS
jgi:hypothetical protein